MSTFKDRLQQQGLLPSTQAKYEDIISGADQDDLLNWIRRKVNARTPLGTILPMRAAVSHYLIAQGYDEEDIKGLLPKAKGRKAKIRHALTPEQLARYHAAIEQMVPDPSRTILDLLPSCGLRISEITGLKRNQYVQDAQGGYFKFRGKGDKERIVPLPQAAERILAKYLSTHSGAWLFPGRAGMPLTPHAVRIYTRKMRMKYPELGELSPHVLRHTYASLMLRKGVDLRRLQLLLGHESIQTTQRYLHPDLDDLRDAARQLD